MPAVSDRVAIVGATGALGFGLAVRLAAAGVPVAIGSRSAERADEALGRARGVVPDGDFTAGINDEVVRDVDVVFLCVPFRNQSENLTNLREALHEGQILVDATVPLAAAVGGRATRTLGVWQGSAAQQAAEMVPAGVRVVAALHTVGAPKFSALDEALDEDVLVCGDKRADKRRVAAILDRIPGLRCIDAGRLEQARTVEMMTALMISINARYKVHAGVKIVGLPEELWPPPSSS
jgi:8-hydroxy-5-deazaflavin:NADPH oxidoreductase